MATDRPEVELEDTSRPSSPMGEEASEVTGQVTSGGSPGGLLMILAGVGVIIGLLALLSSSQGDGESASSTTEPPATEQPVTDSPTSLGTDDAAPEDQEPRVVVTPPTTLVPGQLLLGEPTGLWLFYGGDDPLQRLDLDNGELIEYGFLAYPVAATGEDLILHQAQSGVSGWVSAANPAEQALSWKRGPSAPGPEPGQAWLLEPGATREHPAGVAVGSGRWQLFELAENRLLDQRPGDLYDEVEQRLDEAFDPASVGALGAGPFDRYRPVGPDYSNRPDGVYRYRDDGYQRLGDGLAIAVDGPDLLVRTCGDFTTSPCPLAWLDGETGQAVDRPLPPDDTRLASVSGAGELVLSTDGAGVSSLVDEPEASVDVLDRYQQVALSPDGRWLAGLTADELLIEDLFGVQPLFRHQDLKRVDGGTLLFVER